jgi:hypothetical protein
MALKKSHREEFTGLTGFAGWTGFLSQSFSSRPLFVKTNPVHPANPVNPVYSGFSFLSVALW